MSAGSMKVPCFGSGRIQHITITTTTIITVAAKPILDHRYLSR
jgi:hypothetical protein